MLSTVQKRTARPPAGERQRARGAATLVVIAALGVLMLAIVTIAHVAGVAVDRAHARAAADATALAAAAAGPDAAGRIAAANGATVVALTTRGADTTVTVTVGRARAEATARREIIWDRDP